VSPEILASALLTAHMIIFWLSQDSNVTPPVCLTAYSAAAIAGSKPMQTGVLAWKIAKGLYIIPLLFAYTPFISGDIAESVQVFIFSLLGIYALAGFFQGFLESDLNKAMRVSLLGAAFLLLWPHGEILLNLFGTLLLLNLLFRSRQISQTPPVSMA